MKKIVFLLLIALSIKLKAGAVTDSVPTINKAINDGVFYINNNIEKTNNFLVYPLCLFLRYNKKIPIVFDVKQMYSLATIEDYNLIKPVVAFSSPDSAMPFPVKNLDTTNYLTCLMYYSFNYPVVNNVNKIIYYAERLYKTNNYDATHCYFSLFILLKRYPAKQLKNKLTPYLNFVRNTVLELPKKADIGLDLKIEAIAMLSEEDIKLIDKADIDYIIETQNEDGSWGYDINNGEQTKMHSTVLALWALSNWR